MSLAATGDEAAQSEVVLRVAPRARVICRSLLGHAQDSADAMQSSLEAILRSASRFRGESTLETWADRITVRTALRAARRRRFWRMAVPWHEVTNDLSHDPEIGFSDALPRRIQDYLKELPDNRREVLVLKYVLGYSVDEIAEATKLSRNTIKYRLKTALSEMRALMRRELSIRPRRGNP